MTDKTYITTEEAILNIASFLFVMITLAEVILDDHFNWLNKAYKW